MYSVTTPGCTAQSEPQRVKEPKAVHVRFSVSFKYHKYWSGNQVYNQELEKLENQLRFCSACFDVIEHDHRGHPYCLTCGSIFPLPNPNNSKIERQVAYENRRFMNEYRQQFEGDDASRIRRGSPSIQREEAADQQPAPEYSLGPVRKSRTTSRY